MNTSVPSLSSQRDTKNGSDLPRIPGTLRPQIPLSSQSSEYSPSPDTNGPTPYLGWKARMSQLPINKWTVMILLVLVRLLIMLAGVTDDVDNAKEKALTACHKVEAVGSAMVSMPYYMSVGVNELASRSITKAVNALTTTLDLILTAIVEIILFAINFYVGTYICLITAFVHGGLDAAKAAIEGVTKLLNEAVNGIANGIDDGVQAFDTALNGFTKIINDLGNGIGSLVGGNVPDIPKLDLSKDIEKLKNLKIDTSGLTADIQKLNDQLPDFKEVKDIAQKTLSVPFDLIRSEVDKKWGNFTFPKSAFPLAKKDTITFCSNNNKIDKIFKSFYDVANTAKTGFIITLVVGAIIAMIARYPIEKRKWDRQKKMSHFVRNRQYDPLDVVYISSRPTSSRVGIRLAEKFGRGRRAVLVRWAWAYATTTPALFLLSLAIAGLFSSLCQFLVLRGVQHEVPELAKEVGNFVGEVIGKVDNISVGWANEANGVVIGFNNDLNTDIFGHITTGTRSVNDTLNVFVDKMNEALDFVFKDTPLYKPVQDVVYCLVGAKVEGIEKGLTWVHDHAHITLPLFDNNTFSQGMSESIKGDSGIKEFLESPATATTDEITGAAMKVTNRIEKSMRKEVLISTGILVVYVVIVLGGIIVMTIRLLNPSYTEGSTAGFVTSRADCNLPIECEAQDEKLRFGMRNSSSKLNDATTISSLQQPPQTQQRNNADQHGRRLHPPSYWDTYSSGNRSRAT